MLAIASARTASHPQQGIVGSFRIWKRNTDALLCSMWVIGIRGSCLHLINNYPSIIDESWSSGPPLSLVWENKTPKDRRWMNNADKMPIRVLKSREPCSANYPYWIMMITLMLSHITPQHLNVTFNLPRSGAHQNRNSFFFFWGWGSSWLPAWPSSLQSHKRKRRLLLGSAPLTKVNQITEG